MERCAHHVAGGHALEALDLAPRTTQNSAKLTSRRCIIASRVEIARQGILLRLAALHEANPDAPTHQIVVLELELRHFDRTESCFSRLNTGPTPPPVNASPLGLPPQAHDSGLSWFAKLRACPRIISLFSVDTLTVLFGC